MKLKHVQFRDTVSFGGMLQSVSNDVVGDRPGQTPAHIEYDPESQFVAVTKTVNGKLTTKLVPMSNVAAFEVLEEVKPAAPQAKR